jgi:hypothetical protein
MSPAFPVEIWMLVLSYMADYRSLIAFSLSSHACRAAALPQLFGTLTLAAHGGPWKITGAPYSRTLLAIAPYVHCVRFVGGEDPDVPIYPSDCPLVGTVLRALPRLSELQILHVLFYNCQDICWVLGALPPSTARLVVDRVDYQHGSRTVEAVDTLVTHMVIRGDITPHGLVAVEGHSFGWMMSWLRATGRGALHQLCFAIRDFRGSWSALERFVSRTRLIDLTIQFANPWERHRR